MTRRATIWLAVLTGLYLCCAVFVAVLGTDKAVSPGLAGVIALIPFLGGGVAVLRLERGRLTEATEMTATVVQARAGRSSGDGRAAFDSAMAPLSEALAALAGEIRQAKGLTKGIVEGLPIPFLLVDTAERVLFTNHLTMAMLEIDGPPQSQVGRKLAEVFYNDPTRTTAVGKSIREGKVFSNLEVTINGHKGGQRHVLANVFPLYDIDGTCIGGLCLYLDMTELAAKEKALCAQNGRIAEAAARATNIADKLSRASLDLAGQIEQSSKTTFGQQKQIGKVAASVDAMGAATRGTSEKAAHTDAIALSAKEKAKAGSDIMIQVLSGIRKVSANVDTLKDHMAGLGEQAMAIGGILGVISDIADQTNLLALNAAIEAARAGEVGRGFAVVADEVRKLAEKTMNATKEVTQNVTAIQGSVTANQATTNDVTAIVADTVRIAGQAESSLDAIVALSDETSGNVRAIAESSRSQAGMSEDVGRITREMAEVAEETSKVMAGSAQSVNDLAQLARELTDLISDMKADEAH